MWGANGKSGNHATRTAQGGTQARPQWGVQTHLHSPLQLSQRSGTACCLLHQQHNCLSNICVSQLLQLRTRWLTACPTLGVGVMSQAGTAPHEWPCALSSSAEAPQPDVNCTIAGLHVSQPVKLCGGGLSIPTGIAFMCGVSVGSCPAMSPAHRPARQRQPNMPPFSSAPLLPTAVHALTVAVCRWHHLLPTARSSSPPGLAALPAALQQL